MRSIRSIDNRDAKVRRVILVEGLANLVVLLAKLVVGVFTGSFAILADAIHLLADLANNLVAWFVVRLSQAPADREVIGNTKCLLFLV